MTCCFSAASSAMVRVGVLLMCLVLLVPWWSEVGVDVLLCVVCQVRARECAVTVVESAAVEREKRAVFKHIGGYALSQIGKRSLEMNAPTCDRRCSLIFTAYSCIALCIVNRNER